MFFPFLKNPAAAIGFRRTPKRRVYKYKEYILIRISSSRDSDPEPAKNQLQQIQRPSDPYFLHGHRNLVQLHVATSLPDEVLPRLEQVPYKQSE